MKKNTKMQKTFLTGALLLASASALSAEVIRLIVPTGPGGGTDIFFRTLAKEAEPLLDASIVIINSGGAGGSIGVSQLVRADPDGLTLAGVWMGPITVAPHTVKVSYSMDDYIPVIQLTSAPYVLCVRPDFPANDGKSFVEELRKHPDKYTYGTDGVAGPGQLATERVFKALNIQARDVPYKGAGETTVALLSKTVDIYTGSVPPAVIFEKNKRAKCLLTTSAERIAALPDAISLGELGIADKETLLWRGIIVPKGTPPQTVLKIQNAFATAANSPASKKFVEDAGEQIIILTGEPFKEKIKKESGELGILIKSLGLAPTY